MKKRKRNNDAVFLFVRAAPTCGAPRAPYRILGRLQGGVCADVEIGRPTQGLSSCRHHELQAILTRVWADKFGVGKLGSIATG